MNALVRFSFLAAGLTLSTPAFAWDNGNGKDRGKQVGNKHVVRTTTQVVGPSGGSVTSTGGTTLSIPPGAIDSNVAITITETTTAAPAGYGAVTTLTTFGPDGTVFAHPITVSMPVPSTAGTSLSVYWSRLGVPGYDELGGDVANGAITTQVVHFSSGFVATSSGTRSVSGSQVVTWHQVDGTIRNIPADLTTLSTVQAAVVDAAGTFTFYPAIGSTNGTFTIDGVPNGPYYVHIGNSWSLTNEPALDLGYAMLGRPEAVYADTSTTFRLNITNLEPWVTGDSLEMYSPQIDTWWFLLELFNPPADGTDALVDYEVDDLWGGSYDFSTPPKLIEGSKGDRLIVEELATSYTAENTPYLSVTRLIEIPAFDELNGQQNDVTAAFDPIPPTNTLSVTFPVASEWMSHRSAIGLNTIPGIFDGDATGPIFYVLGQAGGLDDGCFSATADFLAIIANESSSDLAASGMTYATPLTGAWANLATVRYGVRELVQLPGTTAPAPIHGTIYVNDLVSAFDGQVIVPRVLPVTLATANGIDLRSDPVGVGVTPTLAWNPDPAAGAPTRYAVRIFHLFVRPDGATGRQNIAVLQTTGTSITVPPGILNAGEPYVFRIDAQLTSVPVGAPNRVSIPDSGASYISGIVTP